ncbi:MAG: YihY/virulence factor BrkB family protein [Papillibacter sp.]|nr:YihY/virulence factor BrkB family protein [Papillibacter sp.]
MKKAVKRIIDIINDIAEHQVGVYAASGAFFMFLSLVPISVLLASILPYTPLSEANLLEYLSAVMPESMHQLITDIIEDIYGSTLTTLSLSILLTLWSASKAFMGLMKGINVIYDSELPKNYFKVRARSGISILMLLLITVVSLVLIVFEHKISAAVLENWPELSLLYNFLHNFRFLLVILLLAFLFLLMYKWMPVKKVRLAAQIPGALIASVLWMFLSWAFSFYVREISSFDTYGSLAAIIIAMMWLFYCMYIILIGAYVNTHLIKDRRKTAEKK